MVIEFYFQGIYCDTLYTFAYMSKIFQKRQISQVHFLILITEVFEVCHFSHVNYRET